VLEGGDGSGKSSHADLLAERFKAEGHVPLLVDEPYKGNPFGVLLREIAKTGEYPESRPALFLACRAALQAQVIVPALAAGRPVISSRNWLSTLVFQQEEYPLDWLIAIHSQLPVKPTHLIVLDIEPEVGMERVGKRPNREVYEQLDLQIRARSRYRDLVNDRRLKGLLAPEAKIVRVDASPPIKDVHETIWGIVSSI
jgi:dTMP kinase